MGHRDDDALGAVTREKASREFGESGSWGVFVEPERSGTSDSTKLVQLQTSPLILLFYGLATTRSSAQIAFNSAVFTAVTAILAIINCYLLIQTKAGLRRVNEAWLAPQEKSALEALKLQRSQILMNVPRGRDGSENASLN